MPRTLLVFALCLPLAVLMGFMLSDPTASTNLMVVGMCFAVLLMPLILSFHHIALAWAAGAYINVFFMPGQLKLWMFCAGISFGISLLAFTLSKARQKIVWVPSISLSLIFLTVVVLVTAQLTGGIGTKAMGSEIVGGKKYFWLLGAVVGFFALIMQTVPRDKVNKYLSGYCLGGLSAALSNIAYVLGPNFYILFLIFPVDLVLTQAGADFAPGGGMRRIGGLGPAALAVATFVAMRWGVRDLFVFTRPYRLLVLMIGIGFSLLSGFRSILVLLVLLFVALALIEKVHKTKLGIALAMGCATGMFLLIGFSDRLPLAAQRSLSWLPVKVDPTARADAKGSLEWRLDMWSVLWDQIPQYFWRGKGYAIDPTDMHFANEAVLRGFAKNYDLSLIASDYHSGPFSVIIPFGIFGVIAIVWFLTASIIVLYKNYRYGPPDLQRVNNFFFAYFVARTIFFLFIFGALEVDLWAFAALIGLSLSVNGGVWQKPVAPALKVDAAERRDRARTFELAGV